MANGMAIADKCSGLADKKSAPVDLSNATLRRISARERDRRMVGLLKQRTRRISPPNSD